MIDTLVARLGVAPDGTARIHAITGKPVDLNQAAYRLLWLQQHEPDNHARTARFLDVQAATVQRLTGRAATSWPSADPLGLFDCRAKRWSDEICAAVGIDAGRLADIEAPGAVLGHVTVSAATETGLRAGTPVMGGGGDGQVAGLGTNALVPSRAYLNIGTAVVAGIHGDDFRVSQTWRTMGSPTGEGYYYESSIRSGTFWSLGLSRPSAVSTQRHSRGSSTSWNGMRCRFHRARTDFFFCRIFWAPWHRIGTLTPGVYSSACRRRTPAPIFTAR